MADVIDPVSLSGWLRSNGIAIRTSAWAVSSVTPTVDGWRMQIDLGGQPGEMEIDGLLVKLLSLGIRPGRKLRLRLTYARGQLPHFELVELMPTGLAAVLQCHVDYDVDNKNIIIRPSQRTNAARTTHAIFTQDASRRQLPQLAAAPSDEWLPERHVRPLLGY